MSALKDVGLALQQLRKKLGLTQKELEAKAGVARTTLSRIENGEMDVKVSTVDKLLDAAGLEAQDLMEALLWVRHGQGKAEPAKADRITVSFDVLTRAISARDLESFQAFTVSIRELMTWARQAQKIMPALAGQIAAADKEPDGTEN